MTKSAQNGVSIIICSRNRSESLMGVIEAIYHQNAFNSEVDEIIVVDDASTDSTREVVERWIASGNHATKYHYEATTGKAFALNRGISAAAGKILIFTDDDVVLTENWLSAITGTFKSYDCIGVAGRLLPDFRPKPPKFYRPDLAFPYKFDFGEKPISLNASPFGVNMAFRKRAFDQYGLFRTDLGPQMNNSTGKGEDSEFGARVLGRGEIIMYAPEALLYHPLESALITKRFLHDWYYQYGRSLVIRKSDDQTLVRYYGVPRYLYRGLMTSCFQRYLSLNSQVRYLAEMECHRIRGEMAQERLRFKSRRAYQTH